MKMKEKSEDNKNIIRKPIWIIGISLIIFLLLLAGSLVILKISRDGLNKVAEKIKNRQKTKKRIYSKPDFLLSIQVLLSERIYLRIILPVFPRVLKFNINP